mmetsp:Transcript_14924/g.42300  ORF Transcript_14924/g.42300 Transcript_14924/m.42300 type:complete len:237 (+) Transcript_14924:88-798(+)
MSLHYSKTLARWAKGLTFTSDGPKLHTDSKFSVCLGAACQILHRHKTLTFDVAQCTLWQHIHASHHPWRRKFQDEVKSRSYLEDPLAAAGRCVLFPDVPLAPVPLQHLCQERFERSSIGEQALAQVHLGKLFAHQRCKFDGVKIRGQLRRVRNPIWQLHRSKRLVMRRNVGLDINNRRAIEQVMTGKEHLVACPVDPIKLDEGQADRVRAVGRPAAEDTDLEAVWFSRRENLTLGR